jgi:hypothetical protein
MSAKKRKKKLIQIRKPKVRLTSKGIKVTKPTARAGDKAGINISSKGISASLRTKHGTVSTRRGCSIAGCLSLLLALSIAFLGGFCAFRSFKKKGLQRSDSSNPNTYS